MLESSKKNQIENIHEKIQRLAEAAAEQAGCLIYDLELSGSGKGRTLRVYIDKKEGTVVVDDCSRVSNALSEALDLDDLVGGGSYHLEVSSPGVERELKKPWHFATAIGKKINLKINAPLGQFLENQKEIHKAKNEAKSFSCRLLGANQDSITIALDDGVEKLKTNKSNNENFNTINLPIQIIEKAKVVFEMPKGQKR